MQKFTIQKRSGSWRTIYAPSQNEKKALRAMLPGLMLVAETLDKAGVQHGFTTGRSPVTNALAHVGWQFTLSMDLSDFFDSVDWEKFLKAYPVKAPAGAPVALWHHPHHYATCFVDEAARQGLPTSPTIANIAAVPMDNDILKLVRKGRFTKPSFVYTRYADDLCFSFDHAGVADMLKIEVPKIAAMHGFKINDAKTQLQWAGAGHRMITGVAVTQTGVETPRYIKRRIRAGEHQVKDGIKPAHWRKLAAKRRDAARLGMKGMLLDELRGLREWAKLKRPHDWSEKPAAPRTSTVANPFAQTGAQAAPTSATVRVLGWITRKLLR